MGVDVEGKGVGVVVKGGGVGAFVEEKGVDVCRCRGKGCGSSCRVERESVWGLWLK